MPGRPASDGVCYSIIAYLEDNRKQLIVESTMGPPPHHNPNHLVTAVTCFWHQIRPTYVLKRRVLELILLCVNNITVPCDLTVRSFIKHLSMYNIGPVYYLIKP